MDKLQIKSLVQTSDSFLENKKNELLLSLYEKNYQKSEQIFYYIVQYIKTLKQCDENSEKLLNQIHLITKKFFPCITESASNAIKKYHASLQNYIFALAKQPDKRIFHVNFKEWEQKLGLNTIQKNLLYKTAMTLQLTVGCSNFCRRCNEWALPKLRSHFSFAAIQKILYCLAEQHNDGIALYGASDPLDWEEQKMKRENNAISRDKEQMECKEEKKTIFDILKYIERLKLTYSLLTKVPKGREHLLKKLIEANANIAVSITSKNKPRITAIEKTLENPIDKQHDLDELLIPARLDEDFISIKPSITDGYGTEITPDGAFIIIPTFTSALHPFGHKKIAVTPKTNFFPIKITGRDALLIDYFKPIQGYDLNNKIQYLDYLLDVQVESIILDHGRDELTPPGMRSIKEYLEIFEEKPRLQREKMTISVLKRLKRQFLFNTNFKRLPASTKALYLKKINAHFDLCKKERCFKAKIMAISFFLKAVSEYVAANPVKTRIMHSLLNSEIKENANTMNSVIHHIHRTSENLSPENLLSDSRIDPFDIFQYYIFQLLENPYNKTIQTFTAAYPSKYDPVADIFVST